MNTHFDTLRARVEEALGRLFPDRADGADALREAMRYALAGGGKRLRPVLTLEFCRLCGAAPEAAVPAACAVELLHSYSLIHDDMPAMDNDTERRGMPACHVRFGETEALLAGDALQAEAFSLLASTQGEPERILRCVGVLGKAAGLAGICGGQQEDLFDHDPDEPSLLRTHGRKTACLISAACTIGAIVGGGDDKEVSAAEAFGTALGMAFQLRDDMLDGDGICALSGAERCRTLLEEYTDAALRALADFPDSEALAAYTQFLMLRNN